MTSAKIPLSAPCITQREIDAIVATLEQGRIGSNPGNLEHARTALMALTNGKHNLLTTSCTAALEMAMRCLNIGPGDEVILPSFTFVSCANAVLQCGGTPVFVDIEDRTLNLDIPKVHAAITEKTKAIMVVHYAGISCDMDALLAVAKAKGLYVLEDAAHAIGASYKGAPLGTLGTFGCFSFHDTKNVTSGEGGALIINDPSFEERAEIMYEKGTNRARFLRGDVDKYTWVDQGSSYTLSALLASLLAVQLERAEEMNAKRGAIVDIYKTGLQPLVDAGHIRFTDIPSYATPNHHLAFFMVNDVAVRDSLLSYLKGWGIGATFHYVPLHSSPFAVKTWGYKPEDMPVSEWVSKAMVRLPLFPHLAETDARYVVDVVQKFFTGADVVQSPVHRSYAGKAESGDYDLDLTLVLPCYQEEPHLKKSLTDILSILDKSKLRYEIILIDDKSKDRTAECIREFLVTHPNHRLQAVFHSDNKGRGATVTEGIRMAKGRYVGFMDIDLEVNAHYLPAAILPLQNGQADVVIADRSYKNPILFFHRTMMSNVYKWLVHHLLKIPFMDTEAGFKFFVRNKILPVLDRCQDPHWFWDTEVSVRSYDAGLRIHTLPVLFLKRDDKKTTVKFFKDSWRSLKALMLFRKTRTSD